MWPHLEVGWRLVWSKMILFCTWYNPLPQNCWEFIWISAGPNTLCILKQQNTLWKWNIAFGSWKHSAFHKIQLCSVSWFSLDWFLPRTLFFIYLFGRTEWMLKEKEISADSGSRVGSQSSTRPCTSNPVRPYSKPLPSFLCNQWKLAGVLGTS